MIKKRVFQFLMAVSMMIPLVACSNHKVEIALKNDEVIIEYGEKLKEVKEYLDPEKMNKDDISKIELDTSSIKNEEGKDYPCVGEYTVVFALHDEKTEMKVTIKDTTTPVFKEFKDTLETEQGKKISDDTKKKSFTAEDLSEVTIKVDDSTVDYKKAGEYKMIVTATDEYGNKTEKECTVKVKEKKKEEKKTIASTKKTTSFQSGNTSSSKTSKSTSSTSKKSSGSNNTASTQTSKPHQHFRLNDGSVVYADESKWFNTLDEADAWADSFSTNGEYASGSWGCIQCSCGKWGVYFTRLDKWEN